MSGGYFSRTADWATYADGRPLVGERADLALVDARIDALDRQALAAVVEQRFGDDLAVYGEAELTIARTKLDHLSEEEQNELCIATAEAVTRDYLKRAVRDLCTNPNVDLENDGIRWTVHSAAAGDGGNLPDEYYYVEALDECSLFRAPLDAAEFEDTIALATMVALLDDLADQVAQAYDVADLPATVRDAVTARLDQTRGDMGSAAAMLRTTIGRFEDNQKKLLWDKYFDAKRRTRESA